MARSTAMRIRMDMALPVNPGDFEDVGNAARKLDELKKAAKAAGFTFTEEVSARVGSYDFGEATPETSETSTKDPE